MSYRRDVELARYQERLRLLEQAERQRQRAPEPEPEQITVEHICLDVSDTAVLLVPVLVLVILGLTCGWAVFWIGLGVLCFVLGIVANHQRGDL